MVSWASKNRCGTDLFPVIEWETIGTSILTYQAHLRDGVNKLAISPVKWGIMGQSPQSPYCTCWRPGLKIGWQSLPEFMRKNTVWINSGARENYSFNTWIYPLESKHGTGKRPVHRWLSHWSHSIENGDVPMKQPPVIVTFSSIINLHL